MHVLQNFVTKTQNKHENAKTKHFHTFSLNSMLVVE